MLDRKLSFLLNILCVLFIVAVLSLAARASECTDSKIGSKFTTNIESCVPGSIPAAEMKKNVGASINLDYVALKTNGAHQFSETEMFTDRADLTIGIDVTGNTQGHTYLVINSARVDGRMFMGTATITDREWVLSRGLILRYKNIPPENMKKLTLWIKSQPVLKTPTCVVAANRILFDKAGFEGPHGFFSWSKKKFWFPSTFLQYLAENGLVGWDGVRLHPEIYTINSDIHDFWNGLPTAVKVPSFFFKVLFDPYTWQGDKASKRNQR